MAITQYAQIADLASSINPAALVGVTDAQKTAALIQASRMFDEALPSMYKLPLLAVGAHVVSKVCDMAIYRLLVGRGYNPEAGGDPGIRERFADALRWLVLVRDGKVTPDITDSGAGAALTMGPTARPTVISSPQRGFSGRVDPNAVNVVPPGPRWPFQGS